MDFPGYDDGKNFGLCSQCGHDEKRCVCACYGHAGDLCDLGYDDDEYEKLEEKKHNEWWKGVCLKVVLEFHVWKREWWSFLYHYFKLLLRRY